MFVLGAFKCHDDRQHCYHPCYGKEAEDKTVAVRKVVLGSGINSVCLVELRVPTPGHFSGRHFCPGIGLTAALRAALLPTSMRAPRRKQE